MYSPSPIGKANPELLAQRDRAGAPVFWSLHRKGLVTCATCRISDGGVRDRERGLVGYLKDQVEASLILALQTKAMKSQCKIFILGMRIFQIPSF